MKDDRHLEKRRNGGAAEDWGDVGRLLGLVPPPPQAPEVVHARVKEAARREWIDLSDGAARRRRFPIAAFAAALLAVVVGAWLMTRTHEQLEPAVSPASLEVATGRVVAFDRSESGTLTGRLLGIGESLPAGVWIETPLDARAALRLAGGQSLRLDFGSRLRLISPELVALESGAIYVDSHPDSLADLEIRTEMGVARDIGTQFELRIDDDALRIRVREGAVELEHAEGSDRADPGSELTLTPEGTIHRRPISRHGADWNWNLAVSPIFDLEGSDVRSFLDWVARETGWQVEYASPAVELAMADIVLHGSLDGVPADMATGLVLETCGVEHRLTEGRLIIDLAGTT